MNQFIKYPILLAVALALGTTSCVDDDDNGTPGDSSTFKSAYVGGDILCSADMLSYIDVTGTYTDADGKSHTATFSQNSVTMERNNISYVMYPISASATSTSLPVNTTLDIQFSLKEGVELPTKLYWYVVRQGSAIVTYTSGASATLASSSNSQLMDGTSSSQIETVIDLLNASFSYISVTMDEDEKATVSFKRPA
ncbi:MAG: hypothetical protein LUC85_11440 [Bacteroidales bacterium]|nr:hypothetical protein [Bacteroidales bacterium]MCD8395414.1 hypothetical protein [Bacteroidales bacterium]